LAGAYKFGVFRDELVAPGIDKVHHPQQAAIGTEGAVSVCFPALDFFRNSPNSSGVIIGWSSVIVIPFPPLAFSVFVFINNACFI
jgi:hypothetical protein